MVLDNETGLIDVNQWMQLMINDRIPEAKPLMFFVTSPERFGPELNESYKTVDLFGDGQTDFYNSFFRDYFDWVKDQVNVKTFRELRGGE